MIDELLETLTAEFTKLVFLIVGLAMTWALFQVAFILLGALP